MNLFRSSLGACALLLVATSLASAGEPPPAPTKESSTGSAVRAFIDPQTGQPRAPTAAEVQALEAQGRARPQRVFPSQPATEAEAAATLRRHPDGMRSMAVPESLFSTLQANKDADGQLHIHHADHDHVDTMHDGATQPQELPHE